MHIHHARSPVEICLETHTYRNIYTPWTPFTPINPTAGPDDPFPTRRQKRPHKQINRLEGDLLRRTCNNQHMKPTRHLGAAHALCARTQPSHPTTKSRRECTTMLTSDVEFQATRALARCLPLNTQSKRRNGSRGILQARARTTPNK